MTARFVRPADTEWMLLAACRDGVDPEIFFPTQDNGPSLSKARRVCASCWVKADCLAYALAMEGGQPAKTREGVYAGTTGGQRYDLYRRKPVQERRKAAAEARPAVKKKREPAECGTRSGYSKHLREKTEICGPCRQANTDADNRLRRTGTTKAPAQSGPTTIAAAGRAAA